MPEDTEAFPLGPDWTEMYAFEASDFGSLASLGLLGTKRVTQLNPGRGYWVYAPEVRSLPMGEGRVASALEGTDVTRGWSVIGVNQTHRYDGERFDRLFRWDPVSSAYTPLGEGDAVIRGIGYWALHKDPKRKSPAPPNNVRGTLEGRRVGLSWKPPSAFDGGAPLQDEAGLRYQIYRRNRAGDPFRVIAKTDQTTWQEVLLQDERISYYVVSLFRGTDGHEQVSERSPILDFEPKPSELGVPPGVFEAPSFATDGRRGAILPRVAIAKVQDEISVHLVYVIPGTEKQGDRIAYRRSPKAGRAGSWAEPVQIGQPKHAQKILDVALAANQEMLSIAWISKNAGEGEEPLTEVRVLEHRHAALWPTSPVEGQLVRRNANWKRGLGLAYDPMGHHHLVWGESSKVYYLKDLQGEYDPRGELLNVFDEKKRTPNQLVVHYGRTEAQTCPSGGECCKIYHEGAYGLALDVQNPKDCAQDENACALFGPYTHRTEETYVENPSIHVDEQAITIIAHQLRMYDNFSYPNRTWNGHLQRFLGPMVPSSHPDSEGRPAWCTVGATAFQQGFRQSWKTDQYACPPSVPADVSDLILRDADPRRTQGWAKDDFYAYDGRRGHPRAWYQYAFGGRWHEKDLVKVAQRPLIAGAWSDRRTEKRLISRVVDDKVVLSEVEEPVETGFERDAWQHSSFDPEQLFHDGRGFEETLTRWRISTVDQFEAARADTFQHCAEASPNQAHGPTGPIYAEVSSGPEGQLLAVYEKGRSSNPNNPAANAIMFSLSSDGGQHWSLPEELGRGYMPTVGASSEGRVGVLYYTPVLSSERPQGSVHLTWIGTKDVLPDATLNRRPARPIHFTEHGQGAERLWGAPRLAAFEEMFFAAWVHPADDGFEQDRIAVTRARGANEVRRLSLEISPLVENQMGSMTVTLEDKFHFQVNAHHKVEVSRKQTAHDWPDSEPQALSPRKAATGIDPPVALALVHGQATLQFTALLDEVGAGESPATFLVRSREEGVESLEIEEEVFVVSANASGNALEARRLRNRQMREKPHEDGALRAVQVEYKSDPGVHALDTQYLAKAERVWVYTQGIALAQYAKSDEPEERVWAQGIARWLCDHAQTGMPEDGPRELLIKGWPFSINTQGDNWRDARLVTGANAWVVHGLGVFLVSRAYEDLSGQHQDALKQCYHRGLRGLAEHRRNLSDGTSIMTAGWTTQGLVNAGSPQDLPSAMPAYPTDPNEKWAYYEILDALGYANFPEEKSKRPQVRTYRLQSENAPSDKTYGRTIALTQEDWVHLRQRVRATNVVTEHNLDVLAVLNHALHHPQAMGPQDPDENAAWVTMLLGWRNSLREGIFFHLWDDKTWQEDLDEHQDALKSRDLGRIVTGGSFKENARQDTESTRWTVQSFHPSSHVAIDNCSWLSLSVNFVDLEEQHREKLAKCLHYTILVFAKDLRFEEKVYYGTHYFKNTFRDPYIEESPLQEKSYHLEATAGLILGLLRFADAYPNHNASPSFRKEAHKLWSDMQDYVSEWGFPYSSERIHNLSTLLQSSTAAIWFIDVYAYLQASTATESASVATENVGTTPVGAADEQTQMFLDGLDVGYTDREVPFEDMAAAVFELGDLLRSPEAATIPQDTLHQFGLKLITVRGKLLSKFGQRAVTLLDDFVQLPPALLLTSLVSANSAAYLGSSAEIDLGLETILTGAVGPSPDLWERQGVVVSEDAVVQPMGSFFRPEVEIRRTLSIFPEGPILANPLENLPLFFQEDQIYFIEMEWLGVETPLGKLGFLTPSSTSLWPVFALRTNRPRAQILEDFIRNHIFWKRVAPQAERWPEPVRVAWLYLVELAIRSDFNQKAAERYAVRAGAGAKDPGDDKRTPPPDVHPQPTDETKNTDVPDKVPGSGGIEGALDGAMVPLSLIMTDSPVYGGLPFDADRAGVKGVPDLVHWVLPKNVKPHTVSTYTRVLTTDATTTHAPLASTLVEGRATVLSIAPPPGSIHVASAYRAMGVQVPPEFKSLIVVPYVTREYIHSHHQVDADGVMIPGTDEKNDEFEAWGSTVQAHTPTYVDSSPLQEADLQKQLIEVQRELIGTFEQKDQWTVEEIDSARTSVPSVLMSARTTAPSGPGGLFTHSIRPGYRTGPDKTKPSAYVYAGAFEHLVHSTYPPLGKTTGGEFERFIEDNQAQPVGRATPAEAEDNTVIDASWIYYIENDGRALNLSLKRKAPESEYVFPGHVKPEQIIGAQEFRWDPVAKKQVEGPFIPNSNYDGRYRISNTGGHLRVFEAVDEEAKKRADNMAKTQQKLDRQADPMLQDLKWASWLFDPNVSGPNVSSKEEAAFQEFIRDRKNRPKLSLLPGIVPGYLGHDSKDMVLPAMPHHPSNQKAFRRYTLDLFRRTFSPEAGWAPPTEHVLDKWTSSSGLEIITSYEIRVAQRDGPVVAATWEPMWTHLNNVREYGAHLIRLQDNTVEVKLLANGRLAWATDAFYIEDYSSITTFFTVLHGKKIRRMWLGVELHNPEDYPPGVAEAPLQAILRTSPVPHPPPREERTLFVGPAGKMIRDGFFLAYPVSVEKQDNGELVLKEDGHAAVALFNGLGEGKIPIQTVSEKNLPILSGPHSASEWLRQYRNDGKGGVAVDEFLRSKSIPAPHNVAFGPPNKTNTPKLHLSHSNTPFFEGIVILASHQDSIIQSLAAGKAPPNANRVEPDVLYSRTIPKPALSMIKEKGFPIDVLLGPIDFESRYGPIPGKKLYLTAHEIWATDDGRPIQSPGSAVFEYTPIVEEALFGIYGDFNLHTHEQNRVHITLKTRFSMNREHFQHRYQMTPQRAFVYIYRADLKTGVPDVVFSREHKGFDSKARWNDDDWGDDAIHALLSGLKKTDGIFVTIKVEDQEKGITIHGKSSQIEFDPDWVTLED